MKKNFAGYRKKCHILIRVVVYGQAKKTSMRQQNEQKIVFP